MKLSGGQLVLKALQDEGIKATLGIPGTHNIELYDVLDGSSVTPYLVTDEQSASFMADGYARSSGEMAVVNIVPGAGLTHAASGITEAYLDGIPLLVLACGLRNDISQSFQLHDIPQIEIARPICKEIFSIKKHEEIYPTIRKACQIAKRPPQGPVFVEVPANLYLFPSSLSEKDLVPTSGYEESTCDENTLIKIKDQLNQSQRIGIYAGFSTGDCADDLMLLAEKLDAVVFTTISGKGGFPENHPRWGWNVIGMGAPPEIQKIFSSLDCLLAIGCRFGEVATASYGVKLPTLIHIDCNEKVFNKNFPAALTLKAHSSGFLKSLLASDLKERTKDISFLSQLAVAHEKIREEQKSHHSSSRISPSLFFETCQKIMGDDAIYVTDSGNGTFLAMEQLRLKHPRSFLGPIDYSCMGYSVPAGIGAKMAHPEKPVVTLAGDGAFLMTGLELVTAKTYELGVITCILNDGELSQIAQFQKKTLGSKTCTTLAELNYRAFAESVGIPYFLIQKDSEIENVLIEVKKVSEKYPVLVEVMIDYSFPTYFTRGAIKANFLRLPWKDRLRFVGRVIKRKII